MCFFLYNFFFYISHSKMNWLRNDKKCIYVHVKYPLVLPDFNETWIFKKYSNVKFHENLTSGSRVVPCRQTDVWQESKESLFAVLQMRLKPWKQPGTQTDQTTDMKNKSQNTRI